MGLNNVKHALWSLFRHEVKGFVWVKILSFYIREVLNLR